jgi:hypothetical protein
MNFVRSAAKCIAMLFIGVTMCGIFGAWLVERKAAEVATSGFGLVETAVAMVDGGVARVAALISTSRVEVRQAAETIGAVGARPEANRPVLNALSERMETSLAPRIAQMQQVLAPVRDGVNTIACVVSLANSIPGVAEGAPRLAALDDALERLRELSADSQQLRSTLRALVAAQGSDVTAETVATLSGLTQRIDTRLGEVQAGVQGVQADIAALRGRLEARKSRLLACFKLAAVTATLGLGWILYSQIVVIQNCRAWSAK